MRTRPEQIKRFFQASMRVRPWFLLVLPMLVTLESVPAQAQPFAYATNQLSHTVSVIDTASNPRSGLAGGSPGSNPGCSVWYKQGAASYNLATVTGYTQLPTAVPSMPWGLLGVLNIGAK